MQNRTNPLEPFLTWAEKNATIRGVILTGSRAGKSASADSLSDFDLAVFGNDFDFIRNDLWLSGFQEFWVCVHDRFDLLGVEIPTRLVLFNDELKVDFSFHPVEILNQIMGSPELPDGFNIGYTILIDKDNQLVHLKAPAYQGFIVTKPGEADFEKNVNEFWFEVFHLAKYLLRNDLWTAKSRDFSTKQWLLQMLEWNQVSKDERDFSPKPQGKEMKGWVDAKTWTRLHSCFGSFDAANSWTALEATIQLYREVAMETGSSLHYAYNQNLDSRISKFIEKAKTGSRC